MNCALDYLARHRQILLDDLAGLPDELLHWRPYPDTFPMARSLRHLAGFELVLMAALAWPSSRGGAALWPTLRSGFLAAELGGDWAEHFEILAAARAQVLRWLPLADRESVELADLRRPLENWGAPPAEAELVARGVARDLAAGQGAPLDLARTLAEHESYHRGQITLLKHLWARARFR